MVVDHRFDHLKEIRGYLSYLTTPVYYLAESPLKIFSWFEQKYQSKNELTSQYQKFKKENLKLLAELQKYESLQEENIRLRSLLDASYKIGDRVLISELKSVDLDPYKQQVIISKGGTSGVQEGQAVIDASGIMGQIIQVSPLSSTVLLITDLNHSIPVQILRNGIRTIALGAGTVNELSLPYLPNDTDIKKGDLLVTSGLGGKFPPGYPVAVVKSIDISTNYSFAKIKASPKARIDRAREVLIVWSQSLENETMRNENNSEKSDD